MLKRNNILLLILLLMFGLVLAACSAEDADGEKDGSETSEESENTEDGTDEDAVDDGPKSGGTVTGAMHTAPAGMFNPIFYEEAYEANILDFTHEGLTTQDENLGFIPALAKEWEINEDQTEITFTLKKA